MSTLLIVESPAKAKKIQNFLGYDFIVKSSYGHICDLNTKKLNSMIDNNFEPDYNVNHKTLKSLKSVNTKDIILAADDDREGDAIAWHCGRLLNVDFNTNNRIIFNEISKKSIINALDNKTTLNMNSVNAQKCRQLLDLIIGYKLSPLLWKHINTNEKNLSAGRVQSCLLNMLVEHEHKINNSEKKIKPKVSAIFNNDLETTFVSNNNNIVINDLFTNCLKEKKFKIIDQNNKEDIKYPPPPYTTSSLQQDAYNTLGLNVKTTMNIAQKLYEAGKITYMRTDSTYISNDFKRYLHNHIISKYGEQYYRSNKSKDTKFSQQAHEAIRPTNLSYDYSKLNQIEKKLYELIIKRTIQSHMSPTIYDVYTYHLSNNLITSYGCFKHTIRDIYFEGYMVYTKTKPIKYKKLDINNTYKLSSAECRYNYEIPPKYLNESMIVKLLEKTGIGRPSTYSSIINTLYNRNYTIVKDIPSYRIDIDVIRIEKDKIIQDFDTITIPRESNKIIVTDLGKLVVEYLSKHFKDIINVEFTSNVELDLDNIANGKIEWKEIIKKIYNTFNPIVLNQNKFKTIKKDKPSFLGYQVKNGKFGPYLTNGTNNYNVNNYCKLNKISLDDLNETHVKKITSYPKVIGNKHNKDILLCFGPYGEYLKYDNKNIKIDKKKSNDINYLVSLIK
uniref:DNA topoisomerase n=1 Tax=viral metagenome TaxID=1070528 RepID=A0A6C0CZJ3_9ZZZZ